MQEESLNCPQCQNTIVQPLNFCPRCGHELAQITVSTAAGEIDLSPLRIHTGINLFFNLLATIVAVSLAATTYRGWDRYGALFAILLCSLAWSCISMLAVIKIEKKRTCTTHQQKPV